MPDPDPVPPALQSADLRAAGSRLPEADIELPDEPSDDPPTVTTQGGHRRGSGLLTNLALGAGTLALLAGAGWFLLGSTVGERLHPNWTFVEAAGEASDAVGAELLAVVDEKGVVDAVDAVEVREADLDPKATRALQISQRRGDTAAVREQLQAAQGGLGGDVALATDLAGLIDADVRVYRIEVWDCCDEDGDAIDLVINGVSIMTVPLTHEPTSLAIPLRRGENTIALRGSRDGRGGVTVAFRTSQGEYYNRRLRVGRQHQIGVVVR